MNLSLEFLLLRSFTFDSDQLLNLQFQLSQRPYFRFCTNDAIIDSHYIPDTNFSPLNYTFNNNIDTNIQNCPFRRNLIQIQITISYCNPMNFYHSFIVVLISAAIFTANSTHSDQVKNYCDGSDSSCQNVFIASKNSLTLKMKLKYLNKKPALEINLQDQNQFKVNDVLIDQTLMEKFDLESFFSIQDLFVFFQKNFDQRIQLSSNGTITFDFPFLEKVKTRTIGTSQKISKGKIQQLLEATNNIKNDILWLKDSTKSQFKNISSTTFYDVFASIALFALIFHSIVSWKCLAKLNKSCRNLSDPHKQYFQTEKTMENNLKITCTSKAVNFKNYILQNELPSNKISTFKFKLIQNNVFIGITTKNTIAEDNSHLNDQFIGYFSGTGVVHTLGKEHTYDRRPASKDEIVNMVINLDNWTILWSIGYKWTSKFGIPDCMRYNRLYVCLMMSDFGSEVQLLN